MKEDKAYILRQLLTGVSLVLIFATAGLLAITTQLKTITFNYYGNIKSIKTLTSSVDAFLMQNQIFTNEDAIIEPAKGSRLKNGMTLSIYSQNEEGFDVETVRESYSPVVATVKQEIEAIPFEEETVNNDEVYTGNTQVLQEGVEGTKSISYIVKSTKDKVIQKEQVDTQILAEAQNRVVEVGTKVLVSRSSIVTSIDSQPIDEGFVQYNIKLPVEQQKYAYNLCKRYGIDYPLFIALMFRESGFNPGVVGPGNYAYGLCQIAITNYSNLNAKLGITDLLNPYDNMTAGAYMLSTYMGIASQYVSDEQTKIVYALNAYNMGEYGYHNNCYSQGIIHRTYSNNVLATRERLISTGGV
ncbi:MAG: G5 domain-containing protein [Clostridia bacterium]|nr:G5 domain-containing protein [Clostridia bacterium]